MEDIYTRLSLPDAARVDRRVFKKMFLDRGRPTALERRTLRESVDRITWKYALKPDTVPVRAYRDEEREYLEIAVLGIELSADKGVPQLAALIHRTIPYPLVVILERDGAVKVSLAHKRRSLAEHDAFVVTDARSTSWIQPSALSGPNAEFLRTLAGLWTRHADFFQLYEALVEAVVALECAALTGAFSLPEEAHRRRERAGLLDRARQLGEEIAGLRRSIQAEPQFNRKVELNTTLATRRAELDELTTRL